MGPGGGPSMEPPAAAPLALAEAADADEAVLERRIAVGKGTALAVDVVPR